MSNARPAPDPFSRPFAWSFSQLKNFEVCPKRHYHVDKMRDVKEEESQALQWGNYLHDKFAGAIGSDDNKQRHPNDMIEEAPLPDTLVQYQPLVDRFHTARQRGAKVYAELSLALTRDFTPTTWFGNNVWFRAKVDVQVMTGDFRFAMSTDWKTGKRLTETPQLEMTAITLMSRMPSIEAVKTEYVWLNEFVATDPFRCVDPHTYTRAMIPDMWSRIGPRVALLEKAYNERNYPPKPGGLCRKWCPVRQCAHHGK